MSKPNIFIIESLELENEDQNLLEGHRLKEMLALSDKQCKYYYLRTEREFREILKEFKKSNFRYLHLSCHGHKGGLSTTFDPLNRRELAEILNPYINYRRVFISACSATRRSLAVRLMRSTTCYSVMGPYRNICFGDAALYWATFYHLMFKDNAAVMDDGLVEKHGRALARAFGISMQLFTRTNGKVDGQRLR